jgi:hypothetical protein
LAEFAAKEKKRKTYALQIPIFTTAIGGSVSDVTGLGMKLLQQRGIPALFLISYMFDHLRVGAREPGNASIIKLYGGQRTS